MKSKYLVIVFFVALVILALLFGFLFFLMGMIKAFSFSDVFSYLFGRDTTGVSWGTVSSGNCAIVSSFEGIKAPSVKGKISLEAHLVTREDWSRLGRWPRGPKEGIAYHLQVTHFKQNCPGCSPNQLWTPAEHGRIGQGSTELPPASLEPWIVNSRWFKDGRPINPPPGTRVIVFAPKTNRAVVGIAGYEWGPSASTGHTFGAQPEVLANLGIRHGDWVIVGFAANQNLPPGPIDCEITPATTSDFALPAGKMLNVRCVGEDYPFQCGVASTAMVIGYLTGRYYTTSQLAGRGDVNIVATLSRYTKMKWKKVRQNRDLAIKTINAGYPVVLYTGLYRGKHIVVLIGYDNLGYFYYNDPLRKRRCRPRQKKRWGEWGCHLNQGCVMVIPAHI